MVNLKKRLATLEAMPPRLSIDQGRAFDRIVAALSKELETSDWIECAHRVATGVMTESDHRALAAVSISDLAVLGHTLESLLMQVARLDRQY